MWNVDQFFVRWAVPDSVRHVASPVPDTAPYGQFLGHTEHAPCVFPACTLESGTAALEVAAIKFSNIAPDSPTDVGS